MEKLILTKKKLKAYSTILHHQKSKNMVKVMIVINQGCIVAVNSTEEIEYVVVDFDLSANGEQPIKEPLQQDFIFNSGEAHQIYINGSKAEMEAKELLKQIQF